MADLERERREWEEWFTRQYSFPPTVVDEESFTAWLARAEREDELVKLLREAYSGMMSNGWRERAEKALAGRRG